VAFVCVHAPAVQPSTVQGLLSSQFRPLAPVHNPAWQLSPVLQGLPSLHVVPFATLAFAHPVAGAHVSVVQTLPSLQTVADPG